MKLSNVLITVASACMVFMTSCRKEPDVLLSGCIYTTDGYYNMVNSYPRSHEDLFWTLWSGMNCNYAAWDIETVDWDSVFDAGLPVVREWDMNIKDGTDTVSTETMKAFYAKMFGDFHDGHLGVKIWNMSTDESFSISPSRNRILRRTGYHQSVSWYTDREYYRELLHDSVTAIADSVSPSVYSSLKQYDDEGFFTDGTFTAALSPDKEMFATSGIIGGSIPYIRFSSFEFCSAIMDEMELPDDMRNISNVYQTWFKGIQKMTYENKLDGVIIDVRGNRGGLVDDFRYFVGSLVNDSVMEVGKYRRKDGIGRLDYGPSVPMILPCRNTVHYSVVNKPIVILADCNSGSMAEMTAYCSKLKDNIFMVGERTYGAMSMLDNSFEATYSGSFGDKEHGPYFVYLPSGLFFPAVGPMIEGTGVEPDYYVPFDMERFNTTLKDNQLEKAVSLIKSTLRM